MENLEWQGFRTHQKERIYFFNLLRMYKILFLLAITVTTVNIGCANAGDKNKQQMQREKHDSTLKEKKETDTLGMKMGGNELIQRKSNSSL